MFLPRDRERIRFLGNAIRVTASVQLLPSTSRRPFAGLHCEHLPASMFDRLHLQTAIISTDPQNSASGASGTGPAQGYRLETLLIHVLILLFYMMNMFHASQVSSTIKHIITMFIIMNYIVIMWIKLIRKIPNYSTGFPAAFADHIC